MLSIFFYLAMWLATVRYPTVLPSAGIISTSSGYFSGLYEGSPASIRTPYPVITGGSRP